MRITASILNKRGVYQRVFTDEIEESRTYLDSTAFAAYCIEVKKIIVKLVNPCIAEIKRAMPGDDRFLMDAIEALSSLGTIKCTRDIAPSRWAIDTPRKVKKLGAWNNDGALNFKRAVQPDAKMIYGDAF